MPRFMGMIKNMMGKKGQEEEICDDASYYKPHSSSRAKDERRTRSDEGSYSETYTMRRESDGSYRSQMTKKRASTGSFTLPKVQRREFEVSKKLGEGSFGQVLYARWMSTGQQVALKVLKEEEAFGNQLVESGVLYEDIVACFEQEVSIMEYCGNHPNIVGLFAKGYDGRVLVMEHCRTDIYRIVKKSGTTLPLRNIRRWGRQVLEAVKHIHALGVIHQDVKSSNILITEDGTAKICDFGLAMKGKGKIVADRELLTLWYRAPELLMGSRVYTNKVDEWGVGVILLEMLHGKVPFNGDPKARCTCRHVSHVNFNADQLSRIFQVMGTPADEDCQPMACKAHFQHWPRHEFKLDELVRRAISRRRSSKDSPAEEPATEAEAEACVDEEEEVERWTTMLRGLLAVIPDHRDSCDAALGTPLFAPPSQLSSPNRACSSPSQAISPFSLSPTQSCDTPPPLGLAMGLPVNVTATSSASASRSVSSPDVHADESGSKVRSKSVSSESGSFGKKERKASGVGRFLPTGWSFMRASKRQSFARSGSGDSMSDMPIPVLEIGDANVQRDSVN